MMWKVDKKVVWIFEYLILLRQCRNAIYEDKNHYIRSTTTLFNRIYNVLHCSVYSVYTVYLSSVYSIHFGQCIVYI